MELTRLKTISVLLVLSLVTAPLVSGSHTSEAPSDSVDRRVEEELEDVYIVYLRNDKTIFFLWRMFVDPSESVEQAELDLRRRIERMEACTGKNYTVKNQEAMKSSVRNVSYDIMLSSPVRALNELGYPPETYRTPNPMSIGVRMDLSGFNNPRTRTLHGFDLGDHDVLLVLQVPEGYERARIKSYELEPIPNATVKGPISFYEFPGTGLLLSGVAWEGPRKFKNGTPRIFLKNETIVEYEQGRGFDVYNITYNQTGDELQVEQKPYNCEKILTETELEERVKGTTPNKEDSIDTFNQQMESGLEDVYIVYIRDETTIFYFWDVTAGDDAKVEDAKLDLRKKIERMEACTGANYSVEEQSASKLSQSRVLDSMPTSTTIALKRLGYPHDSYRYPDAKSIGVSMELSGFQNNRTRTLHGFSLDRDDLLIVQQLPPRSQKRYSYELKSIPKPSFEGHITPVNYSNYSRLLHGIAWKGPQDFSNGTPRIFMTNETKTTIATETGFDIANINHIHTGDELHVEQKPYACEKVLSDQELDERLEIDTRDNDSSIYTTYNNTSIPSNNNTSTKNESTSEAVPGFTFLLALMALVLAFIAAILSGRW